MMMAARATGKEPCMHASNAQRRLGSSCRPHCAGCTPSCGHVCQRTWLYACMHGNQGLGTTTSALRITLHPKAVRVGCAQLLSGSLAEGPIAYVHP